MFERVRDALAQGFSEELVAKYADTFHFYNITADEERGVPVFNAEGGQSFAPEEMMASMLHYVLDFTKEHAKSEIRDAVLTVPPFFGQEHRVALLDAAEIAGMNVLALLNEPSAAALQYGIDKKFEETTHVVFYDMGATNTWAALYEFNSYTTGKGSTKKSVGQFVPRAIEWDEALGGEDFDVCLMDHFAQEFNAKHEKMLGGVDIRTVPRAMGKMRKEVAKTKEVLSLTANVNAPCNVEAIYEDTDLRSSINPPKFHELCADLFARVAAPLERVLERASEIGVTVDMIENIELLGGGTRIPRVVEELSKTLGGRDLDRHLDSAEAVVFGTALYAANLSTTFRMRPFGLNDVTTYPMTISMEGEEDSSFLPPLKVLPNKRVVSLPFTGEDAITTIKYGEPSAEDVQLPPGVAKAESLGFNVSGMADVQEKYTLGGDRLPTPKYESANITKVKMHFGVDRYGLVSLNKAEAIVEVVEMVNVTIKPPKAKKEKAPKKEKAKAEEGTKAAEEEGAKAEGDEATEATEEGADAAEDPAAETSSARKLLEDEGAAKGPEEAEADESAEESDKPAEEGEKPAEEKPAAPKYELKAKNKTFKPQLRIEISPMQYAGLDAPTMEAAKETMRKLNDADLEKLATAAAKNELEAYAIETRSKMRDEDSGVFDVSSEEEREVFIEALTDAEDWLYMDGADEPSTAFVDKLAELKKTGDAIFERLNEMQARPAALKAVNKWITKSKESLTQWPESKPYINATKIANLLEDVEALEEFVASKTAEQEERSLLEEPAYRVHELAERVAPLQKRFDRLKATPKPKPPKAKVNATKTNATDDKAEGEATAGQGEGESAAGGDTAASDGGADEGGQAGAEGAEGVEGAADVDAPAGEEDPAAGEGQEGSEDAKDELR